MILPSVLFALLVGLAVPLVRSPRSNLPIHLIAPLLAILLTKLVFGDWDHGYQWSSADVAFLAVIGGTGYLGALGSSKFL